MACNGDDSDPEGKVNHWCNVSGELLAPAVESGVKPKRGAPSTAALCKLHTTPSHDTHTNTQLTMGAPYWGGGSIIYACELWIYQASEGQYMLVLRSPPFISSGVMTRWLVVLLLTDFYWFIRSGQEGPSVKVDVLNLSCSSWVTDLVLPPPPLCLFPDVMQSNNAQRYRELNCVHF